MNAAQERRRLEEELRRQEVRMLCATSSLTLGDLAKRREGVTSFVASAGRGGASESPCGGRGRPGVSRINTLEIGASRRRTHVWRRSGSDRRFHARLQCRLRWPHVLARMPSHNNLCHCAKMQAAAETRRQEEHRKVRKSNSMLQSTRSLSARHVRQVLGSVLVLTVCGRSKPRQKRRRA